MESCIIQLKENKIFAKLAIMIKVFSEEKKGDVSIVAVADHQKDLNNLRLLSYSLFDGKDKVQLNKQDYGGPYVKFKCSDYMDAQGKYDMTKIQIRIEELKRQYN